MKNFRQNSAAGRHGGARKFNGKRPFRGSGFDDRRGGHGGRDSAPQMFKATCAACGKTAEVPFRPNGSKPVFCKDCFGQEDRAPRERSERGAFGRPKFAVKRTPDAGPRGGDQVERRLNEMNMKLDRIIMEIEALKEQNG